MLCRLIGVNPFDQPDVEAAKVAARAALADPAPADSAESDVRSGDRADIASELARLRGEVPAGGYLAIQAYLDEACTEALGRLRDAFAAAWGVPVTLGIGPRFLHSTGQLHKGGAPIGVYLQLLDAPTELAIPHSDAGFATLIAAQARGDREVLRERGRPVLALRSADAAGLIERIRGALAR